MTEVKSASKDALAAIFGKGSDKAQVGSEPPAGAQGTGTVDEPFDQGNAPEQRSYKAQLNSEPPSGAQGNGTVDEPFDQGNAPEQAPISNATASSSEIDQCSGLPQAAPNGTQTKAVPNPKSHLESVMGTNPKIQTDDDPSPTSTPAPAPEDKKTEEPKTKDKTDDNARGRTLRPRGTDRAQERSVSPGTMPDGSHAVTSGDRGEAYTPQSRLGKLKGKVFGH